MVDFKNIKATAKSDLRESGKRVAVKKTAEAVQAGIVNLLSEGKTGKEKASIRKSVSEALETPGGQAAISFLIGAIAPMVEDKVPEKYRGMVKEGGQEFRVQAEVYAAMSAIDVFAEPAIKAAMEGLTSSLDGVLAAEKQVEETTVRAEYPQPQIPVETHEVEAVKSELKTKKKS
jgi:hypothetical protein